MIGELEEEKISQAAKEVQPKFGLTVEEITPELAKNFGISETSGLVVVQVGKDSPAGEAGLRPGDVILEVDQTPFMDLDDYDRKAQDYQEGDTILYLVKRKGATLYLTLKVRD